jgi:glutamyl-tRNA synthetase
MNELETGRFAPDQPVRVRYAPSPTGYPHVGNIRTALFNWLFTRHYGGKFILRIEDTDRARVVEGALESILDSMRWLGMDWDEGPDVGGEYGPYFQSERSGLYQPIADQLIKDGRAYYCYCSPERLKEMREEQARRKQPPGYDRTCRDLSNEERSQGINPVIRFKIPLEGQTSFHDLIRGDVTVNNSTLDDFVLLKSDGYPTYHLASIVDDNAMRISHVLRADEWLASTPRHVLLYEALGYEPPQFIHLPMILGPDHAKLSKRHGATALTDYQEQGYLPESIVNFLALLGWSLDDKTELFTIEELIHHFSVERLSKTGAIFNVEKLNWMNGVYMRNLSTEEFIGRAIPFLDKGLPPEVERPLPLDYLRRILPLEHERAKTFSELPELVSFFFLGNLEYDANLLLVKKMTREKALEALTTARERLEALGSFDAPTTEELLRPLATELELKTGELFGTLRVAVTGRTAAPPLFETMEVLGRERCLERIDAALHKLQ